MANTDHWNVIMGKIIYQGEIIFGKDRQFHDIKCSGPGASEPVELPNVFDDSYILNMEITEGYEVEEMPKSVRIKLNENDGNFDVKKQAMNWARYGFRDRHQQTAAVSMHTI